MNTHWDARSRHWGKQGPPLQPNQEVIDFLLKNVSNNKNILLLGVTPQIANQYYNVTAVDYSYGMIERVWPGNTPTKKAVLKNWLDYTPLEQFDAVIGDGSINMLMYPSEVELMFNRLHLWINPGKPFICRMFTRFDTPVTLEQIHDELKTNTNFSAWRRLLHMYIAEQQGPVVKHHKVLDLFNDLFPDRSKLPWSSEECSRLDVYKDTVTSTWFPTRKEIQEIIPKHIDTEFIDVGTYHHYTAYPMLVCKIKE